MSKRLLTVSLAIAVASALIFIPLTAGGQEGRSEGAQPGAAVPSNEGGGTVDQGTWDGDGPAPRDQVILDDLIVDGSICAGLDCVNGESFGFDTLRLKENNLRIKFQDTSTSASFPTNDWQITANESSNGGANKFSVDDIDGGRTPFTLEAGAPSHSLYVDDGGRIGLGTSTPVVEVHVKDGDTPTVRLEQDGSSGFTPQTWDLAGNETNFFVRDATNGSLLPFRIRPSAPSNSIYVDTNGNVGLGTSSPADDLQISDDGPSRVRLTNTTLGVEWIIGSNSNGDIIISDIGDSDTEFLLTQAGDLTVFGTITCEGGTQSSDVGTGC